MSSSDTAQGNTELRLFRDQTKRINKKNKKNKNKVSTDPDPDYLDADNLGATSNGGPVAMTGAYLVPCVELNSAFRIRVQDTGHRYGVDYSPPLTCTSPR